MKWFGGVALLGAALMAGVWGCAPAASGEGAASLPASDHPLSGAPAPDFSLTTRGGEALSVSAHQGEVLLLDFWATWCEPCRVSFPEYEALAARYGQAVAVFGISEDDEDTGIDPFVSETGATFKVAWDADKSVARLYQIKGMPTLFVIDKSGLVRFVHSGFRPGDEATIRAAIESLL